MQLIGYLDSPFVRRVAISMRFLGIEFEHRELSIWRDYDEFRRINPLVKVPTLVCDDGQILVDSGLIIEYLEARSENSLVPQAPEQHLKALHILGAALIAMEKSVALIYEKSNRPSELQYRAWIERVEQQLEGAVRLLESAAAAAASNGRQWLVTDEVTQADITTAVAWRFMHHVSAVDMDLTIYPALAAFSARAEALPEFIACPLSE